MCTSKTAHPNYGWADKIRSDMGVRFKTTIINVCGASASSSSSSRPTDVFTENINKMLSITNFQIFRINMNNELNKMLLLVKQ